MFQTFDAPNDASAGTAHTRSVRALMQRAKIDALIVPRADEHQGEYVPLCAERLKWLTGFSGSAGTAVVTRDKAALFTDGRYTLAARAQIPTDTYEIVLTTPTDRPVDWLIKALPPGAIVGIDPWLHTVAEVSRLQASLMDAGLSRF